MDALVLGELPTKEGPYQAATTRRADVSTIQDELDGYLDEMQSISLWEPDEVFRRLSAWTARATEILVQANRTDSATSRALINKEITPFIKECDRQFSFHSRIQSVRDTDQRLAGNKFA